MSSLSDILKDLEVEIEGEDKNKGGGGVDIENFDFNKLPEDAQPVFKTLMDQLNEKENTIAGQKLVLDTMKQMGITPAAKKEESPPKKKDDDLDDEDLTPREKKLFESINELKNEITTLKQGSVKSVEQNFKDQMKAMAQDKETADIVRYVPTMRDILQEHPTLVKEPKTLYELAKAKSKGGTKEKDIKQEKESKVTEMGTFSNRDVKASKGYSSIEEAYDAAITGTD